MFQECCRAIRAPRRFRPTAGDETARTRHSSAAGRGALDVDQRPDRMFA